MLIVRMKITGKRFIRLLRSHNIPLSVFAVNAKISFAELNKLKLSQADVPPIYLTKLNVCFGITEQEICKYNKAA